jgi:nucleotide-binding universal stress UspA family protein
VFVAVCSTIATKEASVDAIAQSSRPRAKVQTTVRRRSGPEKASAPIVAAVDGTRSSYPVINSAVRLAAELSAPLVFVYVRRGPAGFLGAPIYQRRLTMAMARASRTLKRALRSAERAGVEAEGEVLEGSPRKRILEFARDRAARLIVVGSRRHKLGRSVSRAVVRASDGPVVVTHDRILREQTA